MSIMLTPEEVVASIQSTAPNPSQIRPPTANLGDLLESAPDDPCFHLGSWQQQWSAIEAEAKVLIRTNDIAQGRHSGLCVAGKE